jgi:RNA polymerase sigma-70 factor (ECF subfamily)
MRVSAGAHRADSAGELDRPAAMPEQPIDAEPAQLLKAIAGRDRGAFRRLYDTEAARLFGIALRVVRDRAVAADAVQEGFIQIWQNAARFDPTVGSARAWIAMIVRYRALDLARARGREVLDPEPVSPDRTTEEPDVLDLLETREQHRRLADCLGELAEKNRRMIVLAFTNGYSHSQIAAQLDLPLGTVKAWIRRGLAALRDCLEA